MTDIIDKGHELYAAFAAGDVDALTRLLSPDFKGQLSPGMPLGLGRDYDGLESMMTDAWGQIDQAFEIIPQPEALVDGGGVLIARGDYIGTARSTGKPLRAAFSHFWSFDGDQFTGVRQITDSGRWRDALQAE